MSEVDGHAWVSGPRVRRSLVDGALGEAEVAGAAGGDQLDDLAVGDVLAGHLGGDPAEVERGDAVGDLEDVVHVVGDEHDAEAVVGEPADEVEHLRVCATPRAAVGSSSRTTLEFQSTALAMATVCRWPPERLATLLAHRLHGAHGQRGEGLAGAAAPC